ncbi:MAG TPA: RagB/SusD family nutrient uptake outer membrane protein [Niastella sp.]
MHTHKIILLVFACMILFSCKKSWIEDRSNKSLDVPNTIVDFQALLDNVLIMNDNHPNIGEAGADNYYVPYALWQTWPSTYRNAYVWEKDIYNNALTDLPNWNNAYRQVFYANIVLDGIDKVGSEQLNDPAWNNAKGSAYFYRAEAFFNISQLYAQPFSLTFPDYPGIPLRLNADPNAVSVRASLSDSYKQIESDLLNSVDYLPVVPLYKTRPSKPAAYALLSRYYLVKQDFSRALNYADLCLKLYDSLLDYNTLNASATYPVPGFNREVIYEATLQDDPLYNVVFVDSNLYMSYDNNDVRKKLLFKTNALGQATFSGTYTGGTASSISKAFGGIASDEIYLTRAECYARTGNLAAAMNDLNSLLKLRWKTGTFVAKTAANTSEALALILQERRKETLFRGLRWLDLRRLNLDGANITLTRNLNNQIYTLPPNDPRYVLPIPPDVIAISGMTQNER